MNKLVVLGSVNADHVLQVPSFPRPGETLHGRNYQVIPGGKGANQAVAAARLNADIGFIAAWVMTRLVSISVKALSAMALISVA